MGYENDKLDYSNFPVVLFDFLQTNSQLNLKLIYLPHIFEKVSRSILKTTLPVNFFVLSVNKVIIIIIIIFIGMYTVHQWIKKSEKCSPYMGKECVMYYAAVDMFDLQF